MSNEIEWTNDGARVTLADYPGYVFDVTHDVDASDPVEDSGCPVEMYTVGAERIEECACDCQATHANGVKDNGNELIYIGGIYADDVEAAALYYASEEL